jgi:hypothetical protein
VETLLAEKSEFQYITSASAVSTPTADEMLKTYQIFTEQIITVT